MDQQLHELRLRIHSAGLELSELKARVHKTLRKYRDRCEMNWGPSPATWFDLSITGTLEDVSACHHLFNMNCLQDFHVIRRCDSSGDEARRRAFTILARAEQRLRGFINWAMTEVFGSTWWESWCPPKLNEKVSGRIDNSDHEIEFLDFGDLFTLMTAQIQTWPEDHRVSASELCALLVEANDFETFKAEALTRTKKRSAWEDIFSKFIQDSEEWERVKNDMIAIMIPFRNKVMHHRPIQLFEVARVESLCQTLERLLDESRESISEPDLAEASAVGEELAEAVRRSVYEPMEAVLGAVARQFSDDIEKARAGLHESMLHPWLEIQRSIQESTEPVLQAQEEWQEEMREILRKTGL